MKSMGDDLKLGDIVEERDPNNPDKLLRYMVIDVTDTETVLEIDPTGGPPWSVLWAIASAMLVGLITLYILH